jgi:TetR/AcrR family transcriptional regulator, fatty acid biosynthesis regulator
LRVNPEKKEERDRITRALLRVTLRLAAEHGFTSLGLREVARAADIAPTSFYRHFADMEQLGLALIEDLVGPFATECAAAAREPGTEGGQRVEALVSRTLRSASEDPDLIRFVLAERLGPIPSFRAALGDKLSVLASAVQEALSDKAVSKGKLPAQLADAALVLLLEGCGCLLEQGQEHAPALRKRVTAQVRALSSGAVRNEGAS